MAVADRRCGHAVGRGGLPDRPSAEAAGARRGARRRSGAGRFRARRPAAARHGDADRRARRRPGGLAGISRPRRPRGGGVAARAGAGGGGSSRRAVTALASGGLDRGTVGQGSRRGLARRGPGTGGPVQPARHRGPGGRRENPPAPRPGQRHRRTLRRARRLSQRAGVQWGADRRHRSRRGRHLALTLPTGLRLSPRRRSPDRGHRSHPGRAVPALQRAARVGAADDLYVRGAPRPAPGSGAETAHPSRCRAGGGAARAGPGGSRGGRRPGARCEGGEPDSDLVEFFATRPVDSIRVLLSQVHRVLNAAEARQCPPGVALAREVLDGVPVPAPEPAPAAQPRRPAAHRVSGVVAPTAGGARSREKMVWEWPDITDRAIEDWR